MWEFLSYKASSISIHIGPAVSFTLGWVVDVPGIKWYGGFGLQGVFVFKTSKRQFGLIDVCSMFMPQSCLCFCKCHSYSDEYQVISLGFLLGSWGALSDMWTITTPCVFGTWCWWWWYDSRRQSPISRSIWWRMLKLHPSIDWSWGIFALRCKCASHS